MIKKPEVSIIIVKYRSEKYLPACLASIGKDPRWEVIIVDNDKENVGYGAGCNNGARRAKGEFLFFLNPDTVVLPGTIDNLIFFIREGGGINSPLRCEPKRVGIVAPLLLDKNKIPYLLQGAGELTPLGAVFAFSFLNKLWPNNPLSRKYWLTDWDKKGIREVAVVPGTAFMIRGKIFEEIGGFDEKFFLYFEENDLCKRVKEVGWRIFIEPQAKVIHFWKGSTPKNGKIKKIFCQSRFYYFKKHWGILPAIIVESFLRSSEWLAEKI